jgi:8-oxo-dGTP pyrophosphatase MutT (NUDIX family)
MAQADFLSQFDSWVPDKTVSVCFIREGAQWLFVRPKHRRGIDRSQSNASDIAFWEPVGGKIDPGETPLRAMRREIQEELGTSLTSLKEVGLEYANFSNAFRLTMHIFRGEGLLSVPQETEEVVCRFFGQLERGQMWDSDFDYFDLLGRGIPFRQYSLYDSATNRLQRSETLIVSSAPSNLV